MKVGFLNNQLDNRGTGNAVFEYAYYNEKILGNKSYIYTFSDGAHDPLMVQRLREYEYPIIFDPDPMTNAVDVMYHIKSGEDDGIRFPNTRYAIHAVFHADQPHGDRYATISEWMSKRDGVPYVPHIVMLPYHTTNYREQLEIPQDAIVFGRYGGKDSFDIPWVWENISVFAADNPDKFFLFMNTITPNVPLPPNVIFFGATADDVTKRKFINTCDAMIHARGRGETFGIAVGEFASCTKPIITYKDSPEKAHLYELEMALAHNSQYFYSDGTELRNILNSLTKEDTGYGYTSYYPEKVMAKFKAVFLDEADKSKG